MTATIHHLPHAPQFTQAQRLTLALLAAADAAADLANDSHQMQASWNAQLILAVARGDMTETIRLAQCMRLADAARSA